MPVADTPATAYLRARCLLPPWPAALRWNPRRRRMLARVLYGDIMRGLHATALPSRERRSYGPVRGAAVHLAAIVGQHYEIEVEADETGARAVTVRWRTKPVTGTMLTHPGVYCLRSNETDWSEQRLWRTYALLTDLEAVFRALKSELGLRPIHHRTLRRAAPRAICSSR